MDNEQFIRVTGNDTETVVKDQNITAKQNYTLNVVKITQIISGDLIELTCGVSSIKMEKSGKITITGTEFDFTANGPANIKGKDVFIN